MNPIKNSIVILGLISGMVKAQTQEVLLDSTKMWEEDVSRVAKLLGEGVRIEKQRVICWFPKDSLSTKAMDSISNMMHEGVLLAEAFIEAPLEVQKFSSENPIECFFPSDNFISHADVNMGYLFIPFWRMKENKAPWLHEILHILLTSKNGHLYEDWEKVSHIYPTWLHEGFADYLTSEISKEQDWLHYDVFSNSYNSDTDSLFLAEYKAKKGIEVVSFIGKKGHPKLLSGSERRTYAPIFYHGSHSLIKYIANTYGEDILLETIFEPTNEHKVLESKTGKTLEQIRKEWHARFNLEEYLIQD